VLKNNKQGIEIIPNKNIVTANFKLSSVNNGNKTLNIKAITRKNKNNTTNKLITLHMICGLKKILNDFIMVGVNLARFSKVSKI